MRPLRLTLTCAAAILGVLCLSYIVTARSRLSINEQQNPPLSSPLSWTAPSSLFPPSAVISLTDDNSTFFLARPASFGPVLPVTGLSGQLWIGSGFGDEHLGGDDTAGELGCSDVPGWSSGQPVDEQQISEPAELTHPMEKETVVHTKRHVEVKPEGKQDGTDDHLLQSATDDSEKSSHADIQSIQESAEIAGKVVLLTRGGCGFLEKVMWVQRRGGTALIVGDDVRGGVLVTMYARGDTSNVTIPSLFTSYTTAHLLSSLMPAARSSNVRTQKTKTQQPKKSKRHLSMPHIRWPTWLWSSKPRQDSRRPPASGKNEWLLQDNIKSTTIGTTASSLAPKETKADAGFVIGVNDWRDPDLVQGKTADQSSTEAQPTTSGVRPSIMPGSGDYSAKEVKAQADGDKEEHNWLGWLATDPTTSDGPTHVGHTEHEGLWVTLQPTSVSSSPFFDALLVLVVSPLVTLTVVYALLLLRARIRRRRWRAPKSVVEQLPVRTYHTMPSTHSSRGSPVSTTPGTPTVTTPLLRAPSRPITYRQRSRETIASGSQGVALSASSFGSMAEKREAALAEWKRKYGGRQRECVVCLEEYVDGVSKVMSLPCGHEFHADCITPWLTTRRRTCPICKGDVVRSLTRNNLSTSFGTDALSRLYEQDEDEDEQEPEPEPEQEHDHEHDHEELDLERNDRT